MNDKLVVVWTSGDREVAENMVFMYTLNAKKKEWFKDVTFIVWGPSTKLLTEDKELRKSLKEMTDEGITIEACLRCAENYQVVPELEKMGVDVKLMGSILSTYLKEDRKIITF